MSAGSRPRRSVSAPRSRRAGAAAAMAASTSVTWHHPFPASLAASSAALPAGPGPPAPRSASALHRPHPSLGVGAEHLGDLHLELLAHVLAPVHDVNDVPVDAGRSEERRVANGWSSGW